jgi:dihydrofolate reductase
MLVVATRKVILQMMVTVDGFVAGPNDEMDWIDNDPVMGEAHFALAQGADAAIIGHGVYRGMAQFWPEVAASPDAPNNEAEFGKLMNDMPKIVVSTEREDLQWTNCEQLLVTSDDDLVERFAELKNEPGEYCCSTEACEQRRPSSGITSWTNIDSTSARLRLEPGRRCFRNAPSSHS